MSSQQVHPRIGVGVFVMRNGSNKSPEFIMGNRIGSVGSDTWALPGGHLEFGETFETCACREIMEETGLEVKNLKFLTATNDIMEDEGKHYVTIFMVCERVQESAEPMLLEPDKCIEWRWVGWDEFSAWGDRQANKDTTDGVYHEPTGRLEKRKLFSPMMALLQQRRGIVPSV